MNIKDIEPTKGHVLVELFEPPKEAGGIILAGEQANNAPVRGVVIRNSEEGGKFKLGEEIFFRKYAIDELKFTMEDQSTQTVFIIDEQEVLGVVRPEKEEEEKKPEQEVRAETKDADQEQRDAIDGKPPRVKKERK